MSLTASLRAATQPQLFCLAVVIIKWKITGFNKLQYYCGELLHPARIMWLIWITLRYNVTCRHSKRREYMREGLLLVLIANLPKDRAVNVHIKKHWQGSLCVYMKHGEWGQPLRRQKRGFSAFPMHREKRHGRGKEEERKTRHTCCLHQLPRATCCW